MFLTGYHGTSIENGNRILSDGKYILSDSDKEWLGRGIYFYFSFSDAYSWNNADAVMHSVIRIDDDEYIDLDTREGKRIFNSVLDVIERLSGMSALGTSQENQCAAAKIIWDAHNKVKVLAESFAKEKTRVKTLLDTRERRREFCVRGNEYVKHTYMIKRSDVDD